MNKVKAADQVCWGNKFIDYNSGQTRKLQNKNSAAHEKKEKDKFPVKTHPSTSFSGETVLVMSSVSMRLTESRGSWTIRPWTDKFSLTDMMLCRTCRTGNRKQSQRHLSELLDVLRCRFITDLVLCRCVWQPHVFCINSNLQTRNWKCH